MYIRPDWAYRGSQNEVAVVDSRPVGTMSKGNNIKFAGSMVKLNRFFGLILIGCLSAANAFAWQASALSAVDDLKQRYQKAHQALAEDLDQLASICREQNMLEEAAAALEWKMLRDPNRQYIFLPPSQAEIDHGSAETDLQKKFFQRLQSIKQAYAAQLFELAKQATVREMGPEAYQWLHETLVFDPEHEAARSALGYRKNATLGWVRSAKPTTARKARTRQKAIGWEKETYWEINSPHFKIYSAAGEQAGLALAEELEQTYWVWRQIFFGYWSNSRQIARWLEGDSADKSGSRQYQVILFRDKAQYVNDLADVDNIEISSGYYSEDQRASFFYWEDDIPIDTWRHEIVHQLLQENAGSNKSVADRGHAWWVEGIAMYFESMLVNPHCIVLGGFDANRMQYARLRFQREGFFVPMVELDAMSREELQSNPDIKRIYTQASGVSQFLMTGEAGRYRDSFLQLIKSFYKDRRFKDSIADAILPLDQLDRAYQRFLEIDREQFDTYWQNQNPQVFALGRAGLTDEDVGMLKACQALTWLDLSRNPITNKALNSLESISSLNQLFLDTTASTDSGMKSIATLSNLQELDLANTRITDKGIELLTPLSELQVLWLADSMVSDQCLDDLVTFSKLQLVDLRRTDVTEQGVTTLKNKNPQLRVLH